MSSTILVNRRLCPSTIARAPLYSSSLRRSFSRVTEVVVRMTDKGVRNSCDASAMNCRCTPNAELNRGRRSLKVPANRPNSSRGLTIARRWSRFSAPIRWACSDIANTGAILFRARNQPPNPASSNPNGTAIDRTRRSVSSSPSSGVSDRLVTIVYVRPMGCRVTRSAASRRSSLSPPLARKVAR